MTDADVAKEVFAAINRFDIPGVLKCFSEDIVRIEPSGNPTAGTYRGHADVAEHLRQGRGTWAEGACEPEKLIAVGNKIVVICHVLVRQKGKTDWIDGRLADVLTFRNGKVTEMRTFWDPEEALAWVGLKD